MQKKQKDRSEKLGERIKAGNKRKVASLVLHCRTAHRRANI